MKRLISIIIAALAFSSALWAQDTVFRNDSSSNEILKELKTIRGLQEETRDKRQHAIREKQRRDSLQKGTKAEDLASDYGIMARIEDNTHKDDVKDGWNLYGITAIVIAVASFWIALITLVSQRRTEKNTRRSQSYKSKIAHLSDLPRHFQTNIAVLEAIYQKLDDNNFDGYPSQDHFEKLHVDKIDIIPVNLEDQDEMIRLNHLRTSLRNYNIESDEAFRLISNNSLSKSAKINALYKVMYKPDDILKRVDEEIFVSIYFWKINDIHYIFRTLSKLIKRFFRRNKYKNDIIKNLASCFIGPKEGNETRLLKCISSDIKTRMISIWEKEQVFNLPTENEFKRIIQAYIDLYYGIGDEMIKGSQRDTEDTKNQNILYFKLFNPKESHLRFYVHQDKINDFIHKTSRRSVKLLSTKTRSVKTKDGKSISFETSKLTYIKFPKKVKKNV